MTRFFVPSLYKMFLKNNKNNIYSYSSNNLNKNFSKKELINIKLTFNNNMYWGISSSIDCKNCDHNKIRDMEYIKNYVNELCKLIDMKKFGETQVVYFGQDERVEGLSMTQLIETSLISGHFSNYDNSAYIDIFSCKFYDPFIAAEFTNNFFKADNYNITTVLRK